MNANVEVQEPRRASRSQMWIGIAIVVALIFVNAIIGRTFPRDDSTLTFMAGIGVIGLASMAWLMSRGSSYPRWAWFGSAAMMCVALVVTAAQGGTFANAAKDIRMNAWMLTWFLMLFGSVPSGARSGVCAADAPRTAWGMVGVSFVVSTFLVGAPLVVRALRHAGPLWSRE